MRRELCTSDVTACECLAVIGVVTCNLRSVPVVTVTHAVPLVLGLSLFLVASVLSLAFVTPCVALILPLHGAWSRRVIRSFQLKILQYLPDVLLIRLYCDAVTTPSMTRFNIPLFSKSASSPIFCFLISDFLDILLMRKKFHCRSISAGCDLVSVHGCHDMFALDTALPHAWAWDPFRQLEIAECRCKLFLPILCGVAHAVQAVLQQPAHVLVSCLVVLWRHNLSSTFTRGDLRQHYFQCLQRQR